jgi:hypothetical protein
MGKVQKGPRIWPELLWYKLNNNILDYSANNIGKVAGTVTGSTNGPLYSTYLSRKAYTFDGGSYSTGNYISLPAMTRSSTMTFSCFINVSNAVQYMRIFDFGDDFFRLYLLNGTSVRLNELYPIQFQSTMLNTWKHIAFTINEKELIGYENGVAISTTLMTASVTPITSSGFIGHSPFGNDPNLAAQMSDFRIYNRVLSSSEILTIFQNNPTLS